MTFAALSRFAESIYQPFRLNRKTRSQRSTSLSFNPLEHRRLLAAIEHDGGIVTAYGGPRADTISITQVNDNADLIVSVNGVRETYRYDSVSKVVVWAGDGDDTINNLTDQPSELRGQDGDDTIRGGSGVDLIRGGDGSDALFGGAGDDNLFGDQGIDVIRGLDGSDTLYGGQGNDELHGNAGNDFLYGGVGDDSTWGADGDDVVQSHFGDDWISGGNGNDMLIGADGHDVILGGAGADVVYGGVGVDKLFGGVGNDRLFGGASNDFLNGEAGNDILNGGFNDDVLDGGSGDDRLHGGNQDDYISGGAGDDYVYGEKGNDRLFGNTGNDLLHGGLGNDGLFGGVDDSDVMIGGEGSDRFLLHEFGDNAKDITRHEGIVRFSDSYHIGKRGDVISPWTEAEIIAVDDGFQELHDRVGSSALMRETLGESPTIFLKTDGGEVDSRGFLYGGLNADSSSGQRTIRINLNNNGKFGKSGVFDPANATEAMFTYVRNVTQHEIGHSWDSTREIQDALPGSDIWRQFEDLHDNGIRWSEGLSDVESFANAIDQTSSSVSSRSKPQSIVKLLDQFYASLAKLS